MKQLFIVETPFQLLNAYEAMCYFRVEKQRLIIRLSDNEIGNNQIKEIVKKLDLESIAKISFISINVHKKSIFQLLQIFSLKIGLWISQASYKHIFIGEYESRFFQFIAPYSSNLILLDDGFKTVITQKNFTSSHHFNWFSLFNLTPYPNQTIYKNAYEALGKKILSRGNSSESSEIIFIGSNLSEEGIISREYDVQLITKICARYADKTIIYIPHRAEDDSKLKKLTEKNANLKVNRLNFPIELLPLYSMVFPQFFISFYSTALITLKSIYKIETIAFKFDYSNSKFENNIDQVYTFLQKNMTVIEEGDI